MLTISVLFLKFFFHFLIKNLENLGFFLFFPNVNLNLLKYWKFLPIFFKKPFSIKKMFSMSSFTIIGIRVLFFML